VSIQGTASIRPPRIVALLVVAIVAWTFLPGLFRPPPHPLRGRAAPALDGTSRGRPMVVTFFATWTDLGEKELHVLDALAARHPDVGFLAIDAVDAADAAVPAHPFPTIHDADDRLARAYQVNNVPMTFVIAANGTIVDVAMGMTEASDLESMIRRAR